MSSADQPEASRPRSSTWRRRSEFSALSVAISRRITAWYRECVEHNGLVGRLHANLAASVIAQTPRLEDRGETDLVERGALGDLEDDVEELGLLKLDVLGIRMQSAMAYALDEVARVLGDLGLDTSREVLGAGVPATACLAPSACRSKFSCVCVASIFAPSLRFEAAILEMFVDTWLYIEAASWLSCSNCR